MNNRTKCCGNCHFWEKSDSQFPSIGTCRHTSINQEFASTKGSHCVLFEMGEKDANRRKLKLAMMELKRVRAIYEAALVDNTCGCALELGNLYKNVVWLDHKDMLLGLKDDKQAQSIMSKWKEKSRAAKTHFMASRVALEEEIISVLAQVRVRVGNKFRLVREFDVDAYKGQGSMALVYARAAATLEAKGLAKKVPGIEIQTKYVSTEDVCQVWAKVRSEVDVLILQRMAGGLALAEWVDACKELNVEPRVFLPFLPKGLEDRLLDNAVQSNLAVN